MKIGIDVHGVISAQPKFWSRLTKVLINNGCEIHILTGHPVNHALLQKLRRWNIHYTHLFSIVDEHRKRGTKMWQDKRGHWFMAPKDWNRTKAEYCREQKLDLHIDDSTVYSKWFETPYAHYKKGKE